MIGKTMMTAAFALATVAAPAMAQMDSGSMQSNSMSGSGSMSGTPTKSQMASIKKCQAMSSDKMMKSKTCMKMQKMYPSMMSSTSGTM